MNVLRVSVRGRRGSAALLAVLLALTLWPSLGSAHAFLNTSTPTANAVVATAPAEVKLEFTERLVPNGSSAQLFNADAVKIDTPASHVGADPHELILPLPADLPRGTYTVQWRNVSADDGHPSSGYFAFTIGEQANIVLPAPPPAPAIDTSIVSLGSISRWLSLLGLAGLIGSLLIWRWAIAPAITGLAAEEKRRVAHSARRLALGSAAVAVVGSLLLLIAQAQTSGGFGLQSVWGVLSGSRFGALLSLRMLLLILLVALVSRHVTWATPAGPKTRWLTLLLVALVPLPYALQSHAAAFSEGMQTAVATDWMHLVAAAVWIGGLLTLVAVLVLVRSIDTERRRFVYAAAIPRFSTIAIIATIALSVTGFYSAWLEVGNLDALWHTTYGRTLVIKLIAIIPLLVLGAINLLIVGPRMRQNLGFARHFGRVVMAEAALGVTIFAIVGVLTGLPTARDVMTFSSGHPAFEYDENGIRAALQIYPGTVGTNRYTADIQPASGPLPDDAQVFLRITSGGELQGEQQIPLQRDPGNRVRFTSQGSELSVVGEWSVDLVVRRANAADWDVASTFAVGKTPQAERAPGLPLRFLGYTPALALMVAAIGLIALVFGLRRRQEAKADRRFTLEAGVALLLVGGLILFLTRAPGVPSSTGNPIPKTAESVAAGSTLYQEHCAVCHGADGHGDGPGAAVLNPPPSDLHAAHVDYHTDKQLFDWIQDGISGSAMSGFKGKMSDQEIWNVVNYVRSLRHPE